MNILFLLTPQSQVASIYSDCTLRQGLEKMKAPGYTALPVLTRDNQYVGTVSEGDFLWSLIHDAPETAESISLRQTEALRVRDIIRPGQYPCVRITVSMEALLQSAMNQNFIPVVDDLGTFIGIVTRKDIIRYFAGETKAEQPGFLRKIV